ncbi:MAG: tetratricopeptide repeat protein [Spirochaetaceae bacterium]|jgi:tetratricopeptide (TPR) repeat protein|nr:tetratricopeptide repeat protein [Spirochaetaceae bacterium]
MIHDPILKKAVTLTRRGKYDDSIKLLEGEIFHYHESFSFHHILGLTCLYAGDFGGALTYFTRAKNIKFRDPMTLLGLAALFLRRGETEKALDLYLDIQDLEPDNSTAKRALKIIRKYGGTEELAAWLAGGKLPALYPPLPKTAVSFRPLPFVILGIIAAAAAGIFLGIRFAPPAVLRGGLEQSGLEKEEQEHPVDSGGSYRYVLTGDEVLSHYASARNFFNKYQDEAAKRELNRIIESNASAAVKNKARLLKGYTETPGFDTLKDRFSYGEVNADPLLYRDCYVLWKGSPANVSAGPDKTSFDLLVGYDTRTVMEGAVAVELDFPAALTTEPLEVLGSVVPLGPDRFYIRGTGIHQSGKY